MMSRRATLNTAAVVWVVLAVMTLWSVGSATILPAATGLAGDRQAAPIEPRAAATANPAVVCDPATVAPDGAFTLPCYGPSIPAPVTTTITETVTQTVTATPAPTTPAPTPTPTPTTPVPPAWPGAANTGVPDGVTLTAYSGSCTVSVAGTTIVGKDIRCGQLAIRAANVVIRDSRITGSAVGVASVGVHGGASLTITDSTIIAPASSTGLEGGNIVATRLDISGGNRGVWCSRCTVQRSWIHAGRASGEDHASGMRAEVDVRFIGNTIVCDIAGDFCSADLTGYPDFQAVHDWLIEGNLFGASTGHWCAYGGATSGKAHSNDADNATDIVFRDNVFQRGASGKCGRTDPYTDFARSRPGNVWSNNRYVDGALIP